MGIPVRIIEQVSDYNVRTELARQTTWIQRINYVVEANSTFCNGSLTLYMATADVALTRLFITLADFTEGDIIRWIFRPKGLGLRGGHKRHGVLRRVQKSLNLREINARKVTAGVKTVWRIDNFTQALGFYFMVVDAGTLFLYEWTSLLQESGQCAANHGLADAPIQTVATAGGFQGGKWRTVISSAGGIVMGPGGASCSGLDVQVVLSLECTFLSGPGPTTVTLRIVTGSEGVTQNTDTNFTVPVGGNGSGVLSIPRNKVSSCEALVKTNGPGVRIVSGTFHITGASDWNK